MVFLAEGAAKGVGGCCCLDFFFAERVAWLGLFDKGVAWFGFLDDGAVLATQGKRGYKLKFGTPP